MAAVAAIGADARAGDAALHVRVRGASRIDAQGVRVDGSAMRLRGTVLDDASSPIARGAVSVTFARAAAAAKTITLPGGASDCASAEDAPSEMRLDADGTVHVMTDAAGHFCVRVPLAIEKYVVQLQFAGTPYVDATQVTVPVDLARRACTLAFTPEPHEVSLDGKAAARAIDVAATLESDGATSLGSGLPLTLSTERGPIGNATTDASGHARFALDPTKLGPPGQGELRVAFQGNADASAASRVASIERHARVTLDVPEAHDGELAPGAPEDGVAIVVKARAGGGEVTGGSVEARVNDRVVGAAPIEAGVARVVATFNVGETTGNASEVVLALPLRTKRALVRAGGRWGVAPSGAGAQSVAPGAVGPDGAGDRRVVRGLARAAGRECWPGGSPGRRAPLHEAKQSSTSFARPAARAKGGRGAWSMPTTSRGWQGRASRSSVRRSDGPKCWPASWPRTTGGSSFRR